MRFTVTLRRVISSKKNPFHAGAINDETQVQIRTWEIEAESAEAVLQFYNEAKSECLPNVNGFTLQSICPEGAKP